MSSLRVAALVLLSVVATAAMAQTEKKANQTPPVSAASVTSSTRTSPTRTQPTRETAEAAPGSAEPHMSPDGALSGNPKAGASKAALCSACHGPDGNSTDAQYPKLAGQNESYIVTSLRAFKSGKRKNAIMAGFAGQLSNTDMHDIGAYYAQQNTSQGVADDALVKPGQTLYRAGDPGHAIPACMSCHGPDGAGNPGAGYPHLAGQHADYVQKTLKAWHDGDSWGTSTHQQIMPTIARRLSSKDIAALASYIEGLHSNTAHSGTGDAP